MAKLEALQSSITVSDLPDKLIENCVHEVLAPLLTRQEAREQNTTARLEVLQVIVSSLASIVKNMFQTSTDTESHHHETHPPVALPLAPPIPNDPAIREEGPPTPQPLSDITTEQSRVEADTDPGVDTASRTLGFMPIDIPDECTEPSLGDFLRDFFHNSRSLSSNQISTSIKINRLWYVKKKRCIYAAFTNRQMCFIIFNKMKNLPPNHKVHKYFPPPFQPMYKSLSKYAHDLRHDGQDDVNTRIDYSGNSLVLLAMSHNDRRWKVHSSQLLPTWSQQQDIAKQFYVIFVNKPTSVKTNSLHMSMITTPAKLITNANFVT